jgi:CheY-like chemotaxis protein
MNCVQKAENRQFGTVVIVDDDVEDLQFAQRVIAATHGFQVLRWLRDHPPYNHLPVVVLTASGEPLVAQYSYELGARSFFQ